MPESTAYFFLLLFGAWVRADPATLLTIFGVLGLLNNLLAFDATLEDVFSDFPMYFLRGILYDTLRIPWRGEGIYPSLFTYTQSGHALRP